jgi:hypothetical protein
MTSLSNITKSARQVLVDRGYQGCDDNTHPTISVSCVYARRVDSWHHKVTV